MDLIVYRQASVGMAQFVEFWGSQYDYPARLYNENIGRPLTAERITRLFEWKNGSRLSRKKLDSVKRNYIERLDEAKAMRRPIHAESFLDKFAEGGAIWRIFWLHCCQPSWPIFDQHVFRAMSFIEYGEARELPQADRRRVRFYVEAYTPFYERFAGQDDRDVDRALWAFGRFLKVTRFPATRRDGNRGIL